MKTKQIATLIYQTDPYIYPGFFGSLANAQLVIPYMLEHDLPMGFKIREFYEQEQLIGIIAYYYETLNFDFETYKQAFIACNVAITEDTHQVVREYFDVCANDYDQGCTYIMDICVDEAHRGKGIGKKMILEFLSKETNDCVLEVNEENERARYLYEKLGFVAYKQYEGYGGTAPIQIIKMKRKREEQK